MAGPDVDESEGWSGSVPSVFLVDVVPDFVPWCDVYVCVCVLFVCLCLYLCFCLCFCLCLCLCLFRLCGIGGSHDSWKEARVRNFHLSSAEGLETNVLRRHGEDAGHEGGEDEEAEEEDEEEDENGVAVFRKKKTTSRQEAEIRRALSRVVSPSPLRSKWASVARVRAYTRDMQVSRHPGCRRNPVVLYEAPEGARTRGYRELSPCVDAISRGASLGDVGGGEVRASAASGVLCTVACVR